MRYLRKGLKILTLQKLEDTTCSYSHISIILKLHVEDYVIKSEPLLK